MWLCMWQMWYCSKHASNALPFPSRRRWSPLPSSSAGHTPAYTEGQRIRANVSCDVPVYSPSFHLLRLQGVNLLSRHWNPLQAMYYCNFTPVFQSPGTLPVFSDSAKIYLRGETSSFFSSYKILECRWSDPGDLCTFTLFSCLKYLPQQS